MTRRRQLKILAVVALVLIAIVTAGGIFLVDTNRQSAIETTLVWARLAPFPPSATNIDVDIRGSMFTREFVITFDASPPVIQQWLAASPGPASTTPSVAGTISTYAIVPGGGAQFAEVRVDVAASKVVIRTYWS